MKKKKDICRELVGTWVSSDPWQSCVEHRISTSKGEYKVVAIDIDDNEKAEVYDTSWDGTRLHYCLHWQSTGRFSKNSLILLDKSTVGLSFTYSEQETLIKKAPAKRKKRKA